MEPAAPYAVSNSHFEAVLWLVPVSGWSRPGELVPQIFGAFGDRVEHKAMRLRVAKTCAGLAEIVFSILHRDAVGSGEG